VVNYYFVVFYSLTKQIIVMSSVEHYLIFLLRVIYFQCLHSHAARFVQCLRCVCVCIGELSALDGLLDFVPLSDLPGLQYVEHVDTASAASDAGLLPGDFILEVRICCHRVMMTVK